MPLGGEVVNNQILEAIKSRVDQRVWKKWFSSFYIKSVSDSEAVFIVSNLFIKDWLEKKYRRVIEHAIKDVVGRKLPFRIEYSEIDQPVKEEMPKISPPESTNLNPSMTFRNFVVGNGNEQVYKFARKITKELGRFSPLFIHGGVGVGKTHILHAIGNEAYSKNPNLKIVYVTSERFMNEMINALRENRIQEFKNKYRGVDLLLMDDVQFLMGKNGVQFELFNTFNELMDKKKQMVFCSDRSPDKLQDFQDRLVSRFKMGIVAEMEVPDIETRKKIAREIVKTEGGKLKDEILDFLSENIDGSLRELRGAIIKLIAYQEIENKELDLYEAVGIVGNLLRDSNRMDPSEKLLATLSLVFDVSPSEIKGRSKRISAVLARQIGMYFAKNYLKLSTTAIAEIFNRSPSVVSSTIKKAAEKIGKNPLLEGYVRKVLSHMSPAIGKDF